MKNNKQNIGPLRGFRELLPEEYEKKRKIIESIRELFKVYGYEEVELPTVEPLDLIALKVGEEIRHRMFRFRDIGGREVVLRPEGTISAARLVVNKMRDRPLPIRVSYVANMFRYDEPQKGRYREFTHIGFEHFGSKSVVSDLEVINVAIDSLRKIGIEEFRIKLGNEAILRSLLSNASIEQKEQDQLLSMLDRGEKDDFFERLKGKVSDDILSTIEKILNVGESKIGEKDEEIRRILKGNTEAIGEYERIRTIGEFLEWKIEGRYTFDPAFARGLEYYTGMIFELYIPELNVAVGGGGRYDSLCKVLGYDLPAVGFALGVDRLALSSQLRLSAEKEVRIGVVMVEETNEIVSYTFRLIEKIKEIKNVRLELDTMSGSIASKMERAQKKGANFVIILGKNEASNKKVTIKRMLDGVQKTFDFENIGEKIREFIQG